MRFLQNETKKNIRMNYFRNILPLELKAKQLIATEIVQLKIAQYCSCSTNFVLWLQYDRVTYH